MIDTVLARDVSIFHFNRRTVEKIFSWTLNVGESIFLGGSTKRAQNKLSSSQGLTLAVHHTAIQTDWKSLHRTCTSFEKDLQINGPSCYPLNTSPIRTILGRCSRIFFDSVT